MADDFREELAVATADIAELRRLRHLTVECRFPKLTAELDFRIAATEDMVALIVRAQLDGGRPQSEIK